MPARRTFTDAQVAAMCNRYRSGESAIAIARSLHPLSESIVRRTLRENGVSMRTPSEMRRHSACNWRFFETIDTEEKAYWLGFLAADGSVDDRKASVIVALSSVDSAHVEAFRDALQATHPIYNYPTKRGHDQSKIVIVSPEMVCDLVGHGVVPRKSLILEWPTLRADLYRHYLRGYSDGDGSFFVAARKSRPNMTYTYALIGNVMFLSAVSRFLEEQLGNTYILSGSPKWNPAIKRLRISGSKRVHQIAHFLYDDATVYLQRKRDRAEPIFASPLVKKRRFGKAPKPTISP